MQQEEAVESAVTYPVKNQKQTLSLNLNRFLLKKMLGILLSMNFKSLRITS